MQNILPVSIAAEVTRTTNSLELSWCILQLCFQPQNIPQKQCPRKCCCASSIMIPRGKCWVIECREDGEKLLLLFGDSFACISFLIISYVFTYSLLKHLETFGNRCPGIGKKNLNEIKNPQQDKDCCLLHVDCSDSSQGSALWPHCLPLHHQKSKNWCPH